jgi:hypothetical protein
MFKLITDAKRSNSAISIHVEDDKFTFNEKTFSLDDLRKRNEFKDFVDYVFPLSNTYKIANRIYDNKGVPSKDTNGNDLMYYTSSVIEPFDAYAQSFNTKNHYLNTLLVNMDMPVHVYFYPETRTFKDALLVVMKQDDHVPFSITTTDAQGNVVPYVPNYEGPYVPNFVLPKCEVTSNLDYVTSSGITLTFKYKDINGVFQPVDCEATAKSDKGYLSHSKFDVKGGFGTFKFIPLGLDVGEEVKIQVGMGKYTNIGSKILTVH